MDQDEEERRKQSDIEERLSQYEDVMAKNKELQDQVQDSQGAQLIIQELISKNKIRIEDDGTVVVPASLN